MFKKYYNTVLSAIKSNISIFLLTALLVVILVDVCTVIFTQRSVNVEKILYMTFLFSMYELHNKIGRYEQVVDYLKSVIKSFQESVSKIHSRLDALEKEKNEQKGNNREI